MEDVMPIKLTGVRVSKRPAIYRVIKQLGPSGRREHLKARRVMMNYILAEIAERHYEAFQRKMDGRRDEKWRKWRKLSDVTVAKKGHSLIGYDTGHMFESFTPGRIQGGRYVKGHRNQVAKATAYSIQFGTTAAQRRKGKRRPKAFFFHHGTRRQPKRPFWTDGHIKRWVADGIARAMPEIARMMKTG